MTARPKLLQSPPFNTMINSVVHIVRVMMRNTYAVDFGLDPVYVYTSCVGGGADIKE